MIRTIEIGSDDVDKVKIGEQTPLTLIAGPCAIESEEHSLLMAKQLLKITKKLGIQYIFKSCYKIAKQYQRYQFRKETRVDEELLREHVRNIDDDLVTCDRYGMMAEIKGGKGKVTSGIAGNW